MSFENLFLFFHLILKIIHAIAFFKNSISVNFKRKSIISALQLKGQF